MFKTPAEACSTPRAATHLNDDSTSANLVSAIIYEHINKRALQATQSQWPNRAAAATFAPPPLHANMPMSSETLVVVSLKVSSDLERA